MIKQNKILYVIKFGDSLVKKPTNMCETSSCWYTYMYVQKDGKKCNSDMSDPYTISK